MSEKPATDLPKGRLPTREVSGSTSYFPPLWSIVMTLTLALIAVAAVVVIVLVIGGSAAPVRPPQLVVLTAPPLSASLASEGDISSSPAIGEAETPEATSGPVQIQRPDSTGRPLDFVMQGPILPTPYMTPTALSISVGATVRVIDVGDQQLNVREQPGVIDVDVVFRAPENTLFTVADGPSQGDGLTWWRIQDPRNSQRMGWAASNYLEVVPPEAIEPTP